MALFRNAMDEARKLYEQMRANVQSWGQMATSPQMRQEYGQRVVKQPIQKFLSKPVPRTLQPVARTLQNITTTRNPFVSVPLQFGGGLTSGGMFGLAGSPTRTPTTTPERLAFGAGSLIGAFNPRNLPMKALGATGKIGEAVVKARLPQTAGKISKLIAPALGREVAQTATMLGGNKLYGNKFNPGTDLAYGLGMSAALGGASRAFGGTIRAMTPLKTKVKLAAKDREVITDLVQRAKTGFKTADGIDTKGIMELERAHKFYYGGKKEALKRSLTEKANDMLELLTGSQLQKSMEDQGYVLGIKGKPLASPPATGGVGEMAYHGTTPEYARNIENIGFKSRDGAPVYLATNKDIVLKSYGKAVVERDISNLKLLDISKPEGIKAVKGSGLDPDFFISPNQTLKNYLTKNGYDGIRMPTSKTNADIIVTNVDKLNLKSPAVQPPLYDINAQEFSRLIEKKYGIKLGLFDHYDKNELFLGTIKVPKGQRGQGIGTKAMEDIIKYADKQNKTLVLNPVPFGQVMPDSSLVKFYKKFGFVENKGKGMVSDVYDNMYRRPSTPPTTPPLYDAKTLVKVNRITPNVENIIQRIEKGEMGPGGGGGARLTKEEIRTLGDWAVKNGWKSEMTGKVVKTASNMEDIILGSKKIKDYVSPNGRTEYMVVGKDGAVRIHATPIDPKNIVKSTPPTTPAVGKIEGYEIGKSRKYPTIHEGGKIKTVEGIPVKIIDGVDTFLREGEGGWVVSEASTGRYISESRTQGGAIAKADYLISQLGEDKFRQSIAKNQLPPLGEAGKVTAKMGKSEALQTARLPKPQRPPAKALSVSQPKPGKPLAVSSSKPIVAQIENPQSPYFNVNRLNVNKATKQAVKQVVEESKSQIEEVVGKKLSNKEVIDFSNVSSGVLHKAVTRQETLAWEAKLLKARQYLAQQAKTGTVDKAYLDNLIAVKSQGTDIARKLQSLNIRADSKEITAKEAILEAILKTTQDADAILKQAKGVDFTNYEQAAEFYRKFVKPSASDWADKIRYSSMLSSPNTHIYNTSSNIQGTGLIAPIEKTITGGIDFLRSKITGTPRQYYAGEGFVYAKGYWGKLHEAAHNFLDVMKGKKLSSAQEMYNLPLTKKGTAGRAAENTLSFFPRLLQAEDEFFQTMTREGVRESLKYRVSKGTATGNIDAKAIAEAKKRLFNAPFNLKEEGPVLKAIEYLPQQVMKARNSANPIVRTFAKLTFPFVRIPSNILKASVEYSPMGLSTIPGATNKTEQLSKAVMGSAVAMATALLTASDRMTWAEPTNADQKNNFRAAGMQPYSVKIGNKWVSFSRLHPAISFNMALVAAVRDAMDNKKLDDTQAETVLNGLAKWLNFYADMSYVKNVGDVVSSAKGDVEGGVRFASNYVQQFIPFRALLGWVNRIVDPVQRKADPDGSILGKQLQYIATQIPLLSQKVPPRTDTSGQPIPNQNRLLNAFSPLRVTTETPFAGEYRQMQDISKLRKIKTQESDVVKKDSQRIYEELNKLTTPQEKASLWDQYVKSGMIDKVKAKQIKGMIEDEKLGLTPKQKSVKSLGVENKARAEWIKKELDGLTTPQEKAALWDEYVKKKIITKEVAKQLKELIK